MFETASPGPSNGGKRRPGVLHRRLKIAMLRSGKVSLTLKKPLRNDYGLKSHEIGVLRSAHANVKLLLPDKTRCWSCPRSWPVPAVHEGAAAAFGQPTAYNIRVNRAQRLIEAGP